MLILTTGLDGAGKTTVNKALEDRIGEITTKKVVSLPYATEEEKERIEFLSRDCASFEPVALFYGGLFRKLQEKVVEYLQKGHVVIIDRWEEIYNAHNEQFGDLSLNKELREMLRKFIFGGIEPDIIFFLNVPVELAHDRMAQRPNASSFDKRGMAYHRKIMEHYLATAKEEGWISVDSSGEAEATIEIIFKKVCVYAKQHGW